MRRFLRRSAAVVCLAHAALIAPTLAGGEQLAERWTDATVTLLQQVKRAVGPERYVLFNGLFNTWAGRLDAQAELLKGADAAAVEAFLADHPRRVEYWVSGQLPEAG